MTRTLTSDAAWCRRIFDSLVDGGVWGVPRSGLMFTKRGEDEFVLTARMPYMDGMEELLTPEQLVEQQDGDLAAISRHMADAGITVIDETKESE